MVVIVILAVAVMAGILFVYARKAGSGDCSCWQDADADTQKDPVCGKEINTDKAAAKISVSGKTFYFCSLECKEKFGKESGKYLGGGGQDKHCGCCG